jgi:hypothetical protein
MWEFSLIELLTYSSWLFVDIRLIQYHVFLLFIKYIYVFIWLWEWGEGPHICDWPGLHITSLRPSDAHIHTHSYQNTHTLYILSRIWGCAWLIDGFWIDDRIYCTLIQLVTALHKPLYDTLCLLFSSFLTTVSEAPFWIQLACNPRYIALGWTQQKTQPLYNSSIVERCRGNVFTEQLPSNGCLLWLHYCGFQESCHNI